MKGIPAPLPPDRMLNGLFVGDNVVYYYDDRALIKDIRPFVIKWTSFLGIQYLFCTFIIHIRHMGNAGFNSRFPIT